MRLIDADKVIKVLNDYIEHRNSYDNEDIQKQRETKIGNKMIEGCIGAIREQPTAYDVDKVIEEIEEWTARINVINDNSGKVGQVDVIGSNKAIKIVEGGGIDVNK